jgi:hypothetical protein
MARIWIVGEPLIAPMVEHGLLAGEASERKPCSGLDSLTVG